MVDSRARPLKRVRQQVPVGAVDLFDARSHPPGEGEEGDAGGDAERGVRVAERVGGPVVEAGRTDGGLPVSAPPVAEVEEATPLAGEEKRRVQRGGSSARASRTRPRRGTARSEPVCLP
jgi:hypothetical protein